MATQGANAMNKIAIYKYFPSECFEWDAIVKINGDQNIKTILFETILHSD